VLAGIRHFSEVLLFLLFTKTRETLHAVLFRSTIALLELYFFPLKKHNLIKFFNTKKKLNFIFQSLNKNDVLLSCRFHLSSFSKNRLLRFPLELLLRRDGLVIFTVVCFIDHSRNYCPKQCSQNNSLNVPSNLSVCFTVLLC
jgi:hypothetical protein